MQDKIDKQKSRADFWEETALRQSEAAEYYMLQLVDAHALLGRLVHQMSERVDNINLTQWFPTDNPDGLRNVDNPTGTREDEG